MPSLGATKKMPWSLGATKKMPALSAAAVEMAG
jgi:hypothetical protein